MVENQPLVSTGLPASFLTFAKDSYDWSQCRDINNVFEVAQVLGAADFLRNIVTMIKAFGILEVRNVLTSGLLDQLTDVGYEHFALRECNSPLVDVPGIDIDYGRLSGRAMLNQVGQLCYVHPEVAVIIADRYEYNPTVMRQLTTALQNPVNWSRLCWAARRRCGDASPYGRFTAVAQQSCWDALCELANRGVKVTIGRMSGFLDATLIGRLPDAIGCGMQIDWRALGSQLLNTRPDVFLKHYRLFRLRGCTIGLQAVAQHIDTSKAPNVSLMDCLQLLAYQGMSVDATGRLVWPD